MGDGHDDSHHHRHSYEWPLWADKLVRDAKTSKRNVAAVVEELHARTQFPKHACWRFVEAAGMKRTCKYVKLRAEQRKKLLRDLEHKPVRQVAKYYGISVKAIYSKIYAMGRAALRRGTTYGLHKIARELGVRPEQVREWIKEGKLKAIEEQHGQITAVLVPLEEIERFCRENHCDIMRACGRGRTPMNRYKLWIRFVLAADVPDDRTAGTHRRERLAAAGATSEDDADEENYLEQSA